MNANVTQYADAWPLPKLSPADRKRIKAALLKAHAAFLRSDPNNPYRFIEPMEQVFGDVASVLLDAGLLTPEVLERQLRFFVVESSVLGGWLYFAKDEPFQEIFMGYWGHRSAWQEFNGKFSNVFSAEIAEWRGKLLEKELEEKSHSLPSTTISGADINDFVAWDGEDYVLRPTRESILADKRLKLIGSVKELSRPMSLVPGAPGYIHVIPRDHVPDQPSHPEPAKTNGDIDTGSELNRRKALLDEYRAATGNPSNKRIYEAKNSGIHKPEFHEWLRGDLPSESATTRNFERFLREKKPPVPRKPHP